MKRVEQSWTRYRNGRITLDEYLRVFREEMDRAAQRRRHLSQNHPWHADARNKDDTIRV